MSATKPGRAGGYGLLAASLIALAVALFFGYHAARLVYLFVLFGDEASSPRNVSVLLGIFSYLTVVTAAGVFFAIALIAVAIAWLCWKAAKRRVTTST